MGARGGPERRRSGGGAGTSGGGGGGAVQGVVQAARGEPPPAELARFLGVLGAEAAAAGAPIAVCLAAFGLEPRWWEPGVVGAHAWGALFAGGSCSAIFNAAIAYGLSVESPIFVALGTVLGIPANIAADLAFRGEPLTAARGVGAALVATSFAMLATAPVN